MSYKSHKKAPGRAFDHLYDLTHKSTSRGMKMMNFKALRKTAPLHIIPCYSSMFTDQITKRRNFYFHQRNTLPIKSCVPQKAPTTFRCNRTIDTNMFVCNPSSSKTVSFHEEVCSRQPKKLRSVKCQTVYRESSAQTDPWLPPATLRDREKCFPEVLTVNCDHEPGVRDVEAIERSRLRQEWENISPKASKEKLPVRLAQLEAFEWENFITRERDLNENQMERMEQVAQMIDDREENVSVFNDAMLENVYRRSKSELERQRSKLHLSHQRKMRKLSRAVLEPEVAEFVKIKPERSLMNLLDSSKSLEELYKSPTAVDSTLSLSKRLNSRKKLWEPKESLKESAHGVRSEQNLRKLCDSLKLVEKREGLRCQTRRSVCTQFIDMSQGFDEDQENLYENKNLIRKTIKGLAVWSKYKEGIESLKSKIEKLRNVNKLCGRDCSETVVVRESTSALNLMIEPLLASI